jgi:CRISPR-associated protein Csb1
MRIDVDTLVAACGDGGRDGGVVIETELEPLAGSGAPVKPAIYAGGQYQRDRRWVGESPDRTVADVIVIDNVPSQANRLEAALEELAPRLGLPTVVLDLSEVSPLPPHLPKELTGFRFPHRQADAYLRDALYDGKDFVRTDVGKRLLAATADDPDMLFEWFPQALLFGFWQSHLGKKGSQAKLARSWVSEVVGIRPAAIDTRTLGLKGDPLNLNIEEKVFYNEDDVTDWDFVEGAKKSGGSSKNERLSEIGHGQVPFRAGQEALAAVSFEAITQRASVSFAGLRRVWTGSPEANAAGRALITSIGLVAHVAAFGRPFSLRSGCDLRPVHTRWTWLGEEIDSEVEPLGLERACDLVTGCAELAQELGLPVGSHWDPELRLTPKENLAKVIRATYPAGRDE